MRYTPSRTSYAAARGLVTCQCIRVLFFASESRDKAVHFATDPDFRLSLIGKKAHDR